MNRLEWAHFLGATLLLNVTPGPDMLYVLARSLGQGRKAGVVSSLGIAAGCSLHAVAVGLGLSRLLADAPFAYVALRYGGAAYLLFLGARMLGKPRAGPDPVADGRTLSGLFFQGMLTNALNPKVALFFLAFLPQFVDPAKDDAFLQLFVLGAVFNFSGTLVNVAAALAAGLVRSRLGSSPERLSGWALIALGLAVAVR